MTSAPLSVFHGQQRLTARANTKSINESRKTWRTTDKMRARINRINIVTAAKTQTFGPCSTHGGDHLTKERKEELVKICEQIAREGKGITACDEGPGTIGTRLENVGMVNTEENRRAYRQMLFEAPNAEKYLSGAILDPETLYQKSTSKKYNGKLFPEVLSDIGIVPGVKPHLKVYALPGQSGATVMQGLDSLAMRLQEYKDAGCKFAKWRSPMDIDIVNGQPSDLTIETNMLDLARYALICQDVGLVPIVEPDVSLKGDHDLETAVRINVKIQSVLFKAMLDHGVYMEGALLKSNMVNPGKKCKTSYTVDEIAEANLEVFRRCFPTAMRSANCLSGGQSLEDASARLDAINKRKTSRDPWNLSFSWSAAIQMPLFDLCKGKTELPLQEMEKLYLKELEIASKSALGKHKRNGTEGDHVGK